MLDENQIVLMAIASMEASLDRSVKGLYSETFGMSAGESALAEDVAAVALAVPKTRDEDAMAVVGLATGILFCMYCTRALAVLAAEEKNEC